MLEFGLIVGGLGILSSMGKDGDEWAAAIIVGIAVYQMAKYLIS